MESYPWCLIVDRPDRPGDTRNIVVYGPFKTEDAADRAMESLRTDGASWSSIVAAELRPNNELPLEVEASDEDLIGVVAINGMPRGYPYLKATGVLHGWDDDAIRVAVMEAIAEKQPQEVAGWFSAENERENERDTGWYQVDEINDTKLYERTMELGNRIKASEGA